MGRIEQAHFRPASARDFFAKAFSLNHRDTDIILSYTDFVSDPASKSVLLDNVARLANFDRPERSADAAARLQIQQRLQGRRPGRLSSPYVKYQLALSGFVPTVRLWPGMLVAARINGGRPLRLLLDTGARGIVIDSAAARKLDLETLAASRLGGFGDAGRSESRVALARSVTFGDLTLEDCLVEVAGQNLTAGADGVIGADVFESFRIGVDGRAGMLQLTPYDDSPRDAIAGVGPGGRNREAAAGQGTGAGRQPGAVPGGYGRCVHHGVAAIPSHCTRGGTLVEMQGAQGAIGSAFRAGPLSFEVGGLALTDAAPLVMDLRALSQAQGIEIAGILGYSTLGKSRFTIDLRNGLLEFPGMAARREMVTRTFTK